MSISREIIDRTLATPLGEAGYNVVEKIIDAGHECYWVGGAIRDMYLGQVPSEIDISTSALPTQVSGLFKKFDDTDALLGATVVSVAGHTFEVTTFRQDDAASDGRHPETVRFGSKENDALRRDATVSAIYWNPVTRDLYDPCGGVADLKERLVRFVGDPVERIRHDALRILRMIRLRSLLHGQYHPDTYAALRTEAKLVTSLSGTRVLQELEKLLTTPTPSVGLEDWFELGILELLLPEVFVCKGVAQPIEYHREGDVWNHLKACTDAAKDDNGPDVRLAALLHDIGKSKTFSLKERIRFDSHAEESASLIGDIGKRLHVPSARTQKLQWLVSHHMMMGSFETLSEEKKAHWYFHPWFKELLQLFWLDIMGTSPADTKLYDSIVSDYDEFLNAHPRPRKPLLSGDEVMELVGIAPGREVGKALQALKDAQIRKDITSKAEAKKFLRKLFGTEQS